MGLLVVDWEEGQVPRLFGLYNRLAKCFIAHPGQLEITHALVCSKYR